MKTVRLIRDKLGPSKKYTGQPYKLTPLPKPLHPLALVAKMHEEVAEIAKAMDDVNEYGDLLDAMLTLAQKNGITLPMIMGAMIDKRKERGSFRKGKVMVRK